MRKLVMLLVMLAGMVLVQGCGYLAITGGKGGAVAVINDLESPGTTNISLEFGDKVDSPIVLTGGMTYIKHDDAWYSPYVEVGPEIGSFVKLGIEVIPESGLYANLLGGVTFLSWSSVWSEDKLEIHPMYGGGITYFVSNSNICIIGSYDNRRGVSAGMGFRF